MVGTVCQAEHSQPGVTQIFFLIVLQAMSCSDRNASWCYYTTRGGGGAVRFCSLKKSILIFKRFLSSQARVVYFCELGQRGSSNLDRVFLWWTGYEAAIWVSPNPVKNNHRLLLSLLLLFRLSFIPSNDRRPSSCLSSFFVLLASSANLRLEEDR